MTIEDRNRESSILEILSSKKHPCVVGYYGMINKSLGLGLMLEQCGRDLKYVLDSNYGQKRPRLKDVS